MVLSLVSRTSTSLSEPNTMLSSQIEYINIAYRDCSGRTSPINNAGGNHKGNSTWTAFNAVHKAGRSLSGSTVDLLTQNA